MMFSLELIKELIFKHKGECSVIYPYIADKLEHYPDYMLPYKGEFLFFESKYMRIKEAMLENKMTFDSIVDIGCQLGIQSCLFEEYDYLGIDGMDAKEFFYNNDVANINYDVGLFPEVLKEDLTGKTVISCMSLGYFEPDINRKNKDSEIVTPIQLGMIEELKKAKYLFVSSTDVFNKELKKHFKNIRPLFFSAVHGKTMYNLFLMTNEELLSRDDTTVRAIESWELSDVVNELHHTVEGFEDGDIIQRIERNDYYMLERISLDEIEKVIYNIDEDLVDEYKELLSKTVHPIILDGHVNGKWLIIDGSHRITVAIERGDAELLAYVPVTIYEDSIKRLQRKLQEAKKKKMGAIC